MDNDRKKKVRKAVELGGGTVELGVSIAVGIAIGYWLDSVLDTTPWMTLFWLLCGVFAGFRSLVRVARQLEEAEREGDRDE